MEGVRARRTRAGPEQVNYHIIRSRRAGAPRLKASQWVVRHLWHTINLRIFNYVPSYIVIVVHYTQTYISFNQKFDR